MLNLELRAEFHDHSIVKISTIFRDNTFADVVPIDENMFNKSGHNIFCNGTNEVASTHFVK